MAAGLSGGQAPRWWGRSGAWLTTLMVLAATLLVGMPGALAKGKPVSKHGAKLSPSIVLFRAKPAALGYRGGTVVFKVEVKHATTCIFSGLATRKADCSGGSARVKVAVHQNKRRGARHLKESVVVKGLRGLSASRALIVTEGAPPHRSVTTRPTTTTTRPTTTTTRPTTTTTRPTTTTSTTTSTVPGGPTTTSTTLASGTSSSCTGPCKFSFPDADVSGFASVQLNQVAMGVPCPDPGQCDATSTEEVDDVNVTLCAGTSGAAGGLLPAVDLSLAVGSSDYGQLDSVSEDANVPTALGSYSAVAAGQCVTGDVYFDSPQGEAWTSVVYAYTSGTTYDQIDYSWNA